ncbi:transmembrane amino acid transporter [Amanita rubescens]|nr:transmembrane amino acid transporter [Amanita rubescens]
MDSKAPLPEAPPAEVVFKDYLFYAALQRQEEDSVGRQTSSQGSDSFNVAGKGTWFVQAMAPTEKEHDANMQYPPMTVDEAERANASRALRLASWVSVFYLITTDILGPFNAPYAISQVGWVAGVVLYFIMGVAATYSGLILWTLFLRLDSLRFPLKTYGDVAERIYGKFARHLCNVLQFLQLIINVGLICLSNGQALSQISKGKLCFAVCIVIFPIIGFAIGQIRSLNNFSFLANSAVWINLAIIFISMGFVAHSPPNYTAAQTSLGVSPGPVETQKFVSLPLYSKINGIMNMLQEVPTLT